MSKEVGLITIKHAAIKLKNGRVFRGKSHADGFHAACDAGLKEFVSSSAHLQGFLTSEGEFVSREKAAKLAWNAGQIEKNTQCLFSEDLWSPVEGGKYDYDSELGYILKEVNR